MSVGFAMLAHSPLARAGQVARHLAAGGDPVAIHLDWGHRAQALALGALPGIPVFSRYACAWGGFNLVRATRDLVRDLLARDPAISHVVLLSGACLPLRPVAALRAHLAAHPDTDFIDTRPAKDGAWVRDGLTEERFSLYHPFSFRSERRRFDLSVRVQRRLGMRRRIPLGLSPQFGSQWWALSRASLERILACAENPRIDRFFAATFIPDESYFHTLLAHLSPGEVAPSLTFSRFDDQGRPFTFYDDHLDLLQRSPAWFARKIWPGAEGLYRHFLGTPEARTPDDALPAYLDGVVAARVHAPRGLRSAGALPQGGRFAAPRPFLVIAGAGPALEEVRAQLATLVEGHVHGRVFQPNHPAQLAWPGPTAPGNLSTAASLRDAMGAHYLSALMRFAPGPHVVFVEPDDPPRVLAALLADPQAVLVTGPAWPTAPQPLPHPQDWRARLSAPPLSWPLLPGARQAHG